MGEIILYMSLGACCVLILLLTFSTIDDYKNKKKCPKCGKRNSQFARRCERCGAELGGKA